MFCNQCGSEVPNGVGFCPNCGAPVEQPQQAQPQYQQPEPQYQQPQYQQPQYQQPQYQQPQYQQPVYGQPMAPVEDPQERSLAKSILTMGILSLAFCWAYIFAFIGIIFGAINRNRVGKYKALYPLTGKAKVGNILGLIGLIVSIVDTAIWLIVIIVAAAS